MTFWTAHLARDREPILLRDGFSRGAFLFGPLWLLLHRAWIPAILSAVAFAIVAFRLPPTATGVAIPALMLLHGLSGNDMLAWPLERRGYLLSHVLSARTEADALARLLTNRPDLIERMARS
ncbi:MAG: DUF2628 domain-containing protein [Rhodospirillales bacterium]